MKTIILNYKMLLFTAIRRPKIHNNVFRQWKTKHFLFYKIENPVKSIYTCKTGLCYNSRISLFILLNKTAS